MQEEFILNKKENKKTIKRPIQKERMIVVVAVYIAIMFFIASIITMGIALLLSLSQDVDFLKVIDSFQSIDAYLNNNKILRINALSQGFGNLIGYFIVFIVIVFVLKNVFIDDFLQLKSNRKDFYKWFIPLSAVLFVGLTTLIDYLIGLAAPSSTNQYSIIVIMYYGGKAPMMFAVILFAPVVEEIIYRKIIFNVCKQYKKYIAYIISILCFSIPHMISTPLDNIGIFLLQCIPYAFSGFLLAGIYDISGENIYASITAHMLNNMLACILIIVQMG